MKRAVFWVLFLSLILSAPAFVPAGYPVVPAETPAAFVERLEGFLQSGSMSAYLDSFRPDARPAEQARLEGVFNELKMTAVSLRTAGVQDLTNGLVRVFVQAFFENEHSAVIESWTLALERRAEAWSVASLDVMGNVTRLYKVNIPSEQTVRARRVEINHADIHFTFSDAAVFYDDLPDVETALVVIGRGKVIFTPSVTSEKHQLELLYRRDRIEDTVESLFIRCSPSYFADSVVIEADERGGSVSSAERDRAKAVFARNYPRSFTIESSIDGKLLSFLPQGDEVSLEFKARKAGEMVYIYHPFSGDEVGLYDHGKERIVCLYSPEGVEEPPLKRMVLSFDEKFDIVSYALDLRLAPASSHLSGRARIEVVPKVDLLDSLKFRFNPALEILKITDQENRELFYTVDKVRQILYVYFISPAAAPALTSVEVSYRGRMPPATPTTDVMIQSGLLESIRAQPRYETSFYTHAGYWYPGPAEEDYFPARLTLHVPPEYSCVANGEMVSPRGTEGADAEAKLDQEGDAVYTFVSRLPVKYLSFIVGKFKKIMERPGPVPVSVYVSSEIMDSRPALVDQAADILDYYGQIFGPYPYEEMGIVLRRWPVFGGHSPASFIVINEVRGVGESRFSTRVDTPVNLSAWEEYFLAHEIAHQWWGQGVSFDSYKDQWLSEGLAQFAAVSYLRRKYGEGAFAAILKKFARWTEKKSFCGPVVMGSRLSYFDIAGYQSIVYDKAALVLFMLQDLVGREAFEAGLRAFSETYRYRAAKTGEFIAAMAAASRRDLKTFFQGWFFTWELPDVRTTWTETAVADGVRIDFRVSQIRGRFVFPLWVEWTRRGEHGRSLVLVDEKSETASLTLPGRPDKIRVNPDKAVPGKFS